jgi:hypothetical protein
VSTDTDHIPNRAHTVIYPFPVSNFLIDKNIFRLYRCLTTTQDKMLRHHKKLKTVNPRNAGNVSLSQANPFY